MLNERISKIMGQVLNVPADQIDGNTSPDTHEQWDSLRHMNLIMALEEEFAVSFSEDEIVNMLTVDAIRGVLGKKASA